MMIHRLPGAPRLAVFETRVWAAARCFSSHAAGCPILDVLCQGWDSRLCPSWDVLSA